MKKPRSTSPDANEGNSPRRVALIALVLGCVTFGANTPRATAADKLTDQSNFALEPVHGPVLGGSRMIGLAGAYTAIAEESIGIPFNPAAVANRTYYSQSKFDWDLSFDFILPGIFQSDDFDFDTNGRPADYDFIVFNITGQLQYGGFGGGVAYRSQIFTVTDPSDKATVFDFDLSIIQISLGYAFFSHQLVIGAGGRIGRFEVRYGGSQIKLFAVQGGGYEAGAVLRPRRWPVRLAVSFSSPLTSNKVQIACKVGQCPKAFKMPTGVALPWELRAGVAYRFGDRSFNPRPTFAAPKRKTPTASQPASRPVSGKGAAAAPKKKAVDLDQQYRGGFYVMVSAEAAIVGAVDNAISYDGFIGQIGERSGTSVTVSPRLGIESEVLRRRLRLRAGTYYEPNRIDGGSGRIHGTFAAALRLFDFSLWGARSLRFATAIDFARQYSNLSLSLGFWH